MTTPFYAPPEAYDGTSEGTRVTLPPDEARHATRVLRLGEGDTLAVVDGAGGWHDVRLDDVAKDRASGVVTATRRDVGEPGGRVVLGLAPLKSADRFETAVEKAVELGVTDLLVLRTARTLGRTPRAERMHHLAVAAMKQSLRTRLLRWHDVRLADVGALLACLTADSEFEAVTAVPLQPIVLHEAAADAAPLADQFTRFGPALVPLVGPEGGFSPDEIALAERLGWPVAPLGPRRLRAETAAVAAATAHLLHRLAHSDRP